MEAERQPETALEQFRAELEVFSGPLDLLLYLVRHEEVDILEVSLSRITDRYLAAVRTMEALDVNVAADFLVVAATLMEIKSRSLLPADEGKEDEEDTAGAELVRRLLQYKEFKEAAEELGGLAGQQGLKRGRPPAGPAADAPADEGSGALLEDLAVWDLMAAFAELIQQTRLPRSTTIVRDGLSLNAYVDEVLDRLRTAGQPLEFLEFFRDGWSRDRIVGIFLALLELVRRKAIQAEQKAGWHIEISLHGPAEAVRPPAEDLNRTQLSDSMGVAAHGN